MTDETERKLHSTDDVVTWAGEFDRLFAVSKRLGLEEWEPPEAVGQLELLDSDDAQGLMIGWFANVVETSQMLRQEQVGWIDEHGNLWSLALRNGAVESDRPVYATKAR